MTLEYLVFGMFAAFLVALFFLVNAWAVIRRVERELRAEEKERRELGYRVQEGEWEAIRCYALLGLKREPQRKAEWVKPQ